MSNERGQCTATYGRFSSIEQAIHIQEEFASTTRAAEILLHEIHHAIWYFACLKDEDDEERIVSASALGWTQVYRDNAWLLKWLAKALA